MALTTYAPGAYELAAQTLHGPIYGFTCSFDVTQWPDPGVQVNFVVQVSPDDGATWVDAGGASVKGNRFVDPNGVPRTTGRFETGAVTHEYDANNKFVRLNSVWTTDLRAKVLMFVIGGSIKTDVSLDPTRTVRQPTNVPDLHHSIALGQHTFARGNDTVSAVTTTTPLATTSGSLILLDGSYYTGFDPGGGAPAFSSFTDNKSNSWSSAVAEHTNGNSMKVRQAQNVSTSRGSGHTFTLTVTNSFAFPVIAVTEYTGQALSPPDKTDTYGDASGTTHADASWTTGTLSQAREVVHIFGCVTGAATPSVSGAWTQIDAAAHNGVDLEGFITAYQVVSATTAIAPSYATTASVATENHVSTWKELASPAKPALYYFRMMKG